MSGLETDRAYSYSAGAINDDKLWRIFTCAQKLANSQLNLPHGTKQKRPMKKLKMHKAWQRWKRQPVRMWKMKKRKSGVWLCLHYAYRISTATLGIFINLCPLQWQSYARQIMSSQHTGQWWVTWTLRLVQGCYDWYSEVRRSPLSSTRCPPINGQYTSQLSCCCTSIPCFGCYVLHKGSMTSFLNK